MKKINTLFVSGLGNNSFVEVVSITQFKTNYVMTGSCNIFYNIKDERINKKYQRIDLKKNQKIDFNNIDIIFNQISDADSHSKVLTKLLRVYKSKEKQIKMINHPRYILQTSREKIYNLLNWIPSLVVPKTVKFVPLSPLDIDKKIEKNMFSFPVILRKIGTHGGESVILLNNFSDTKKLYSVALDGSAFYLIQYIDYKEDNIYKKFRLVVIEGEVFIRHVIFGETWMLHSRSKNLKFKKEELEILSSFEDKLKSQIQPIIDQIYKEIKLEYFGIDCCITRDLKIYLFELNANMNVLIGSSKDTYKLIDKIKNAITEMIVNKR